MKVPVIVKSMVFSVNASIQSISSSTRSVFTTILRSSESGIALTEFAIALPFLVMLTAGVTDISRLLNQYMGLSQVAHFAVRQAQSIQQINLEAAYISSTCPNDLSKIQFSTLPPSNPIRSIENKTITLLNSQNLQIDPSSICITAGMIKDGSGANPLNVYVTITANYKSLISPVDVMPIYVRSEAPYLAN